MATRINKLALVLGLAGAFAMSATASYAKNDKNKYPKDSYEAWGADPGKPPVPGFALSGYKPGLCWKVSRGNADRQFGDYVPCSEWKKKN